MNRVTETLSTLSTSAEEAVIDGRDLLLLPDHILDMLPIGVYVCDADGLIVRYNRAAAELWGQEPRIGDPVVRFCGSLRLFRLGGEPLPHADAPMAVALATGCGVRDQDVVIERPDGTRLAALASIEVIKSPTGEVVGAVNAFRDNSRQDILRVRFADDGMIAPERILQSLPAAIYTTDPDGRITFFNEAAAQLWGIRPEIGSSNFCGSWKLRRPDGSPLAHEDCPMAIALREKRAMRGAEAMAERPDGTLVPFLAYPTPFLNTSGALIGAVNMLVDISERKIADQTAQRLAAIVEFSEDAILTTDLNGIITSWNRGAERLYGYRPEEAIGQSVTLLMPEDLYADEPLILDRVRRGERVEHYETIRRRKDGRQLDISLTVSPLRDSQGRVIGASKIGRDITERRRQEQALRLVLREMDHRVKNLFAISSSIVSLSARSANSASELAETVQARLGALCRAHSLTVQPTSLDGGTRTQDARLHALIQTVTSPYDGQTDQGNRRIAIDGCDVPVSGKAVTGVALLLHEFATNAAKYGSLSLPGGTVKIDCSADDDFVYLEWIERGGPSLDRPENEDGFGSLLVQSALSGQLKGEISRNWRPEGLAIRVSMARVALTS